MAQAHRLPCAHLLVLQLAPQGLNSTVHGTIDDRFEIRPAIGDDCGGVFQLHHEVAVLVLSATWAIDVLQMQAGAERLMPKSSKSVVDASTNLVTVLTRKKKTLCLNQQAHDFPFETVDDSFNLCA
jgi:hypothetical protein